MILDPGHIFRERLVWGWGSSHYIFNANLILYFFNSLALSVTLYEVRIPLKSALGIALKLYKFTEEIGTTTASSAL